jgi:segregation and condensation protein A
VVASKLLLLKSKALIPALELNEDEEGEIKDLETRLKIYAELKATQSLIKEMWHDLPQMFSREFLMLREPVFYPPSAIGIADLEQSLKKLVGELERIMKPVKTIKIEVINLQEKIEEVIRRISETPIEFGKLRAGKGRDELVVLFLAILHLIKERLINVEQKEQFGEIRIAK